MVLIHVGGLLLLLVASWYDFRTREVPDFLSYAFILFAAITSIISVLTPTFDAFALGQLGLGVGAGVLLALILYYGGMWGGADSKLLIGASFLFAWGSPLPPLLTFLVFLILAGGFYGILYTLVLVIKHWKLVKPEYNIFSRKRSVKLFLWGVRVAALGFLVMAFLVPNRVSVLILSLLFYAVGWVWAIVKVAEKTIFIKERKVSELTEGDWVLDVVKSKGFTYNPTKTGISALNISKLKKFGVKNKVRVREGVPFVPSFFFAYVLTLFFHEWLSSLLLF